ncbi:MAG TPA: trypsin-like serine protease, partial [Polyangiaceae bacterium]
MNKSITGWLCISALSALGCAGYAPDTGEETTASSQAAIVRPTATGGRNEVVLVYALIGIDAQGAPVFRTCSGSYFAPRVVLTAAHCLQNVISNQLFVYWGDNFATDVS